MSGLSLSIASGTTSILEIVCHNTILSSEMIPAEKISVYLAILVDFMISKGKFLVGIRSNNGNNAKLCIFVNDNIT